MSKSAPSERRRSVSRRMSLRALLIHRHGCRNCRNEDPAWLPIGCGMRHDGSCRLGSLCQVRCTPGTKYPDHIVKIMEEAGYVVVKRNRGGGALEPK